MSMCYYVYVSMCVCADMSMRYCVSVYICQCVVVSMCLCVNMQMCQYVYVLYKIISVISNRQILPLFTIEILLKFVILSSPS